MSSFTIGCTYHALLWAQSYNSFSSHGVSLLAGTEQLHLLADDWLEDAWAAAVPHTRCTPQPRRKPSREDGYQLSGFVPYLTGLLAPRCIVIRAVVSTNLYLASFPLKKPPEEEGGYHANSLDHYSSWDFCSCDSWICRFKRKNNDATISVIYRDITMAAFMKI